MEAKSLVVVEQPQNVQKESVLIIEQFLNDNYRLASLSEPFAKDWTRSATPRLTSPCMSTLRRCACTTPFWLS